VVGVFAFSQDRQLHGNHPKTLSGKVSHKTRANHAGRVCAASALQVSPYAVIHMDMDMDMVSLVNYKSQACHRRHPAVNDVGVSGRKQIEETNRLVFLQCGDMLPRSRLDPVAINEDRNHRRQSCGRKGVAIVARLVRPPN